MDEEWEEFDEPPPIPNEETIPNESSDQDATVPTQPATQLVVDPRRLGQPNSGLNNEDLADICCILHPSSLPAYRAAALIHEQWPENTINSRSNVKIREKNPTQEEVNMLKLDEEGLKSCDLALRLSARLRDPVGGWVFGRHVSRCDFVIGKQELTRRISNIHFRIYINEYGIIMLEDQSTNGTAVDGVLLRGKEKENGKDYRHTIDNGSVITLTMVPPEEDYRFTVRIPQRDAEADLLYNSNLTAFFLRMNTVRANNEARVAARGGIAKTNPPNLFPPTATLQSVPPTKSVREWRGGTKYNKIGCIGKGAFAVVYKITDKYSGVPYAAKELEKRRFMKNGILDQKVDNEMKIMRQIQHPHVVQYIEHVDWEEYLYIIMEYVPGGDLGTLIGQHGYLPETDVKTMAGQLLSALKYLHDGGITHRDVKPDNILIYNREPFHVKLTDFGLSKMIDSDETFLRTFCGTLLYCAPEVYSEYREYDHTGRRNFRGTDKKSLPPQRYGHAVDIWSLAGVLFYALCGHPPYPVTQGTTYQELLNHIMTKALDIRPLQSVNISESGIRFVRNMLHIRPEYRATIEDLQISSWFVGGDSLEVSMEEDEVDLIGDGFIDPELEEGTSQLSINPKVRQIIDSDELDENPSDLTELQDREIPSSFSTSEGNSNENESYGFILNASTPANGRLFGEVNVSAVGSSGVIPLNHLNLPVPVAHQSANSEFFQESRYVQTSNGVEHSRIPNHFVHSQESVTQETRRQSPPLTIAPAMARHPGTEDRAVRSSSLMGAESMVGNLNMHSLSSAPSPGVESPVHTTEDARDATVSLRRPREDETDNDGNWRPSDMPAKRRRKSEREIDMPVPPSIFWDPKDKSTHHTNYPRMMTSDFRNYSEYAESKGEQFYPGHKTFDLTMQSFRSSRSPSFEADRAHSEPTKEEGRRMLMKRDERQLAGEFTGSEKTADEYVRPHSVGQEEHLPSTARPSPVPFAKDTTPVSVPTVVISSQPRVGNDFQPPKRILAKAISTTDSCLPTITLNITEPVTSWGRGSENISRYANGQEIRIPKYAFKIFLFKPGFYTTPPSTGRNNQIWQEKDEDMKFYISTKATNGIYINDVYISSHDPKKPVTESKYWGELKHGDVITAWQLLDTESQSTKLRFECYWGQSREIRKEDEPFCLLEEGEFLDELESACLAQETAILEENKRRDVEDKKVEKRDKEDNVARLNGSRTIKFEEPSSVVLATT